METDELDCGDNSCLFAVTRGGGMGTNGGCCCLDTVDRDLRRRITRRFQRDRAALAASRAQCAALAEALEAISTAGNGHALLQDFADDPDDELAPDALEIKGAWLKVRAAIAAYREGKGESK